MAPHNSPPQVSYPRLAAVVISSLVIGFSLGAFFYRRWVYEQRAIGGYGVNSGRPEDSGSPQSQPPVLEQQPAPSSLTMITPGPMGPPINGQPSGQAAHNVTTLIRRNESRYETLAIQYTRKYPAIRQYGRDWAGYPDLRRYNDEYMQDHDPIKFSYHVASSKNFGTLIKQYAGRPEITSFIVDLVKATPTELLQASRDFLSQDGRAYDLLRRFTRAVGLPDSILAGMTQGSSPPNGAASALQADPKFREFLQQGNINPDQINSNFNHQ